VTVFILLHHHFTFYDDTQRFVDWNLGCRVTSGRGQR